MFSWRSHANLLYRNWLNWIYQMTPYEFEKIPEAIADLRGRANGLVDKF